MGLYASETEEEKRIWQTPTHKSCKYLPFYSVSSLKNLPSIIHRSGLQIPPKFFGRKSRNFLSLGQVGAAPNGRLCKTSLLTDVSRVHSKGVQSQNTELCLKVWNPNCVLFVCVEVYNHCINALWRCSGVKPLSPSVHWHCGGDVPTVECSHRLEELSHKWAAVNPAYWKILQTAWRACSSWMNDSG